MKKLKTNLPMYWPFSHPNVQFPYRQSQFLTSDYDFEAEECNVFFTYTLKFLEKLN